MEIILKIIAVILVLLTMSAIVYNTNNRVKPKIHDIQLVVVLELEIRNHSYLYIKSIGNTNTLIHNPDCKCNK